MPCPIFALLINIYFHKLSHIVIAADIYRLTAALTDKRLCIRLIAAVHLTARKTCEDNSPCSAACCEYHNGFTALVILTRKGNSARYVGIKLKIFLVVKDKHCSAVLVLGADFSNMSEALPPNISLNWCISRISDVYETLFSPSVNVTEAISAV